MTRSYLVRRALLAAAVALGALSCKADDHPSHEAVNLAQGASVSLEAADGDAAAVVDGRLVPEGASPAHGAVALAGPASSLVADMGAVRSARALLLQATAGDVYFVEASLDGRDWDVVWRVAPMDGVPGLRTRTVVLPRPVPARWLRVRTTTHRSPAVSELQGFAVEPASWPRLDKSLPTSAMPLWPDLTPERVVSLRFALAAIFMAVACWNAAAKGDTRRRTRRGTLVLLGLASLLAWPNFLSFHRWGIVHKWDTFHYYVGGKYLPELSYTWLYTCTAAVDAADGVDMSGQVMRDLRDNTPVPVEAELARAAECPARFSPERWEAFQHDVRFFREAMGPARFASARIDHGFNGTPAWAIAGVLLARSAPASWAQVETLVLLDFALLLGAFVIVGRVFGVEAACLAAAYFGLNALAPFSWTGGSFLRYDWLFCLVTGIAALRRDRPLLAGFALACSALLRVFPACVLLALLVKAVFEARRERRIDAFQRRARVAAGAAIAAALGVALSTVTAGRMSIWTEFAANSLKHAATPMTNMIGLEVPLAYRPAARLEVMADPVKLNPVSDWEAAVRAAEEGAAPLRWLLMAAFAALFVRSVRVAPDWAAAVLGLGLVPVLFKLSAYYYCMLLVYALLAPWRRDVGAALAVLTWATCAATVVWDQPDEQYRWCSMAVLAFVTGVAAKTTWPRRDARHDVSTLSGQQGAPFYGA